MCSLLLFLASHIYFRFKRGIFYLSNGSFLEVNKSAQQLDCKLCATFSCMRCLHHILLQCRLSKRVHSGLGLEKAICQWENASRWPGLSSWRQNQLHAKSATTLTNGTLPAFKDFHTLFIISSFWESSWDFYVEQLSHRRLMWENSDSPINLRYFRLNNFTIDVWCCERTVTVQ